LEYNVKLCCLTK